MGSKYAFQLSSFLLSVETDIPNMIAVLLISPEFSFKTSSTLILCSSEKETTGVDGTNFLAPIIDKKAFLLSLSVPEQA